MSGEAGGSTDGSDHADSGIDLPRIEHAVRELLLAIGEDPDRDGLARTPRRVAEMYLEIASGLHEDPSRHLTVTFEADHDEMVMVRDIPIYSYCEHHLLPFHGRAHVAYIPGDDGRITGLSKVARLVDGYAKRPQVQERLTTQIADAIVTALAPRGLRAHRGRAPVHVDAGCPQAGFDHRHLGGSGPVQGESGHQSRGDVDARPAQRPHLLSPGTAGLRANLRPCPGRSRWLICPLGRSWVS